MLLVLLAAVGLVLAGLGRVLFRSWVNHITIYSVTWLGMLWLHELRLIRYYPLTATTWLVVAVSTLAFVLGSVTALLPVRASRPRDRGVHSARHSSLLAGSEARLLRQGIVVLSGLSAIAIVYDLALTYSALGASMFSRLNATYVLRLSGGSEGGIPYLGSLVLGAVPLAGIHAARHRLHPVLLIPLVLIVLRSVGTAGRATLVIAASLLAAGYALGVYHRKPRKRHREPLSQRLPIAILVILCVTAVWYISTRRGLVTTFGIYETEAMGWLRQLNPALASFYSYLAGPVGVLNEYMKEGAPAGVFAGNTLAWLYRLLERLGVEGVYVSYYSEFYYTPVAMNAGTYIRYVVEDLGLSAIATVPYLLGLSCSISVLVSRAQRRDQLVWIAVASYLLSAVFMSWDVWVLKLTYWVIGLLSSVAACWYIDWRMQHLAARPTFSRLSGGRMLDGSTCQES